MAIVLILLIVAVALVGSLTPPTPGARTIAQTWAGLRRTRLPKIAVLLVAAVVGGVAVVAYAIVRGYGWLALLALAALVARLATLAAMDGRAVRICRADGGRA